MTIIFTCDHIGQLKTEEKSNEITAIPELIKLLDIKGALVTIDAMACQTEIAKTVVEQGADYLLAVKNNQGKLRQAVEAAFATQRATTPERIKAKQGHARIEVRQAHVLSSETLDGNFSRWNGLKSIVMVENFRYQRGRA